MWNKPNAEQCRTGTLFHIAKSFIYNGLVIVEQMDPLKGGTAAVPHCAAAPLEDADRSIKR